MYLVGQAQKNSRILCLLQLCPRNYYSCKALSNKFFQAALFQYVIILFCLYLHTWGYLAIWYLFMNFRMVNIEFGSENLFQFKRKQQTIYGVAFLIFDFVHFSQPRGTFFLFTKQVLLLVPTYILKKHVCKSCETEVKPTCSSCFLNL